MGTAQSASPETAYRSPALVLVITGLTAFMAFLDSTIVNIAFPSISESFRHSSVSTVSWVLNAYNVGFAALLIPCGCLADLLGRRRVLTVGLVLFTVTSLLCAVSPDIGMLIAMRALQAVGAALLVPASLALLLPAFSEQRRAFAIAIYSAAAAAAAGIGPALGGLLVSTSSWRLVFLVNVPLGALCLLGTRRVLTESLQPSQRRPSISVSIATSACIALVALAIVQGDAWGRTSPRVIGSLCAAALLLGFCAQRIAVGAASLVDQSLLRTRTFRAGNSATLAFSIAFYATILCNVLFLTTAWHYSVLRAGMSVTPPPLVAMLVAGPAGRWVDKGAARLVSTSGSVVFAAGLLLLVHRSGLQPHYWSVWLPTAVLTGIGAGMVLSTLATVSLHAVPTDLLATASATNGAVRQLGAVLGVALLVSTVGSPRPAGLLGAFHHGWAMASGAAFLAGLLCLRIPPLPRDDR